MSTSKMEQLSPLHAENDRGEWGLFEKWTNQNLANYRHFPGFSWIFCSKTSSLLHLIAKLASWAVSIT